MAKAAKAAKATKAKATKPTKKAAPKISQKRELLDAFRREHEKTFKVLRAFPRDQAEIRPHPKLKTARELAYVFVLEQAMVSRALKGEPIFGSGSGAAPAEFDTVVSQLEKGCAELESLISQIDEASLEETTQFPVGPKVGGGFQMGDWTRRAFAWFVLSDHIHHRGQLSVYLRMAGGTVPAIYGPSGDETWR